MSDDVTYSIYGLVSGTCFVSGLSYKEAFDWFDTNYLDLHEQCDIFPDDGIVIDDK